MILPVHKEDTLSLICDYVDRGYILLLKIDLRGNNVLAVSLIFILCVLHGFTSE